MAMATSIWRPRERPACTSWRTSKSTAFPELLASRKSCSTSIGHFLAREFRSSKKTGRSLNSSLRMLYRPSAQVSAYKIHRLPENRGLYGERLPPQAMAASGDAEEIVLYFEVS